jgi:uncharacterized protein (DUF305 family)
MAFQSCLVSAVFCLGAATAFSQQTNAPLVPLVQPGPPGASSKSLSSTAPPTPFRGPLEADTKFMQGMIMHHAQAVEMTDMMPSRTKNKALLALGKRISISQTDEIRAMKQWLQERGKPETMEHDMGAMDHSKMDHSKMDHSKMAMAPMMMPGMLTPEQMKALAKATGPAFDRLFLTGMIQHHNGALIMVDDLFNTAGAGQDNQLYDFATDVDNTQRAEINIMQGMLKGKK